MTRLCLVFTLLLALSELDEGQGQCRPSPLWMFALPNDIDPIFPGNTQILMLVENGRVTQDLLSEPSLLVAALFSLPQHVVEFPVVVCIADEEFEEVGYSVSFRTIDSDILTGSLSVNSSGVITHRPYRFRILFTCSESSNGDPIILEISFNISTSSEIFCPINLYVPKRCGGPGDRTVPLNIPDGFLNQNFTFKDVALPVTKVIPATTSTHLTVTLPAVLVPLILVSLTILLAIFIVWGVWYRRKRKEIAEWRPEAVSMAYQGVYTQWIKRGPHEKEVPREKVHLVRELGEGAFGVVFQAAAEGLENPESAEFSSTDVAVKQLREGSNEVDDFFREVDFMSKLDHPNVVKLVGVCSLEEPFCMIFEYMDLGDLCNFLRQATGLGGSLEDLQGEDEIEPLLTESELLTIATQVAEGMVYISSLGLVHRDLATRNCLVATGLVVKIGDFGMSRSVNDSDYYRVKGNALLPVRWMAPESIMYGKFTMETDVWAYGVLLWEIFTFGQQPYSGCDNDEVIQMVQKGGHPDPPDSCPAHNLMLQCWDKSPKKRPSFMVITTALNELTDNE